MNIDGEYAPGSKEKDPPGEERGASVLVAPKPGLQGSVCSGPAAVHESTETISLHSYQ